MGFLDALIQAALDILPPPTTDGGFVGWTTGDFGSSTPSFGSTWTPGGITPL
jgi:hypothetical protein